MTEEIDKELDELWKLIEEGHAKFKGVVEKMFQDMDKELKAASERLEGLRLNLGEGQKVEARESSQKPGRHDQKSTKKQSRKF